MKDVVAYKCLFVWEVQLCILQAPSAHIPCSAPCTFTAAARRSSILLTFHKHPPPKPALVLLGNEPEVICLHKTNKICIQGIVYSDLFNLHFYYNCSVICYV